MQTLPDLNNLKENSTISSTSHIKKEKILQDLLLNYEQIKILEEDNLKLKNILVENQNKVKTGFINKINILTELLIKNDQEYKNTKYKLKDNYNNFVKHFNSKVIQEKEKNQILHTRNERLINLVKKLEYNNQELLVKNTKIQYLLKKTFEKKIYSLSKDLRFSKSSHKNILKEHQKYKIEYENELQLEKNKVGFLSKKHKELILMVEKTEEENKKIKDYNKKLISKIDYLHNNILSNNEKLESRFEIIKEKFEEKLKQNLKQNLDKEIEYKARVDSLNKDLGKYIHELKNIKEKYYTKEQVLKEKIKNILD